MVTTNAKEQLNANGNTGRDYTYNRSLMEEQQIRIPSTMMQIIEHCR